MYQSFDDIVKAACARSERRTIAIAQAADDKMIHVAREVTELGLCDVILVGDAEKIRALMAADGASTADIAQALTLSEAAINSRLQQAYGKLGIHSRADLAGLRDATVSR